VAESYFVDASDPTLTGVLGRLQFQELERRRRKFRLTVVLVVSLAHLLVAIWLLHARLVEAEHVKPVNPEAILWMLKPRPTITSNVKGDADADEMVRQAYKAVILLRKERAERPGAITLDFGMSLGEALACGAGSFEYLTPQAQLRCRHTPWHYAYDGYGNLILRTAEMPPPARDDRMRGTDARAAERNTADPCLAAKGTQTECIDKIIFGGRPP
jgi:hypothetical protein